MADTYVLAFDTSNEVIAIGLGKISAGARSIELVASIEKEARRASNTMLLPLIDTLLEEAGVVKDQLACIGVGRGPGSFTGVRIALATAKGIAFARGIALVGISTQETIAWGAWESGARGRLLVVSDAMRKELYPAYFQLDEKGVCRLSADRVVKVATFIDELDTSARSVTGDALAKYREDFPPDTTILDKDLWTPSGQGLLHALSHAWHDEGIDILDAHAHDPALLLPIYTRLSDAEEHERERLKLTESRNLKCGVQDCPLPVSPGTIAYRPLDANHVADVAALEASLMGSDAWRESMVADELARPDRTWWMALDESGLVGYAGGLVVDGDMQVLKVAVALGYQRRGIAQALLAKIAEDAMNLAATTCSLEVRASNTAAQALYEACGLERLGYRRRYYSDGEDALIMKGDIATLVKGCAHVAYEVAGISVASRHADGAPNTVLADNPDNQQNPSAPIHPLILAIESSCDETAASIIDGSGRILSDVVASQIDFHARFGGVVPEIASRKHIEAICGVCSIALEEASAAFAQDSALTMADLDGVAATYAPGLVGALVVGVAFAKGASWARSIPFIGVNHMEGHLYANKLDATSAVPFEPPAIVSLVSGGNTMLVHMKDWQDYEVLGQTIDDAVGEAFDKVAKALGLPYPGGPVISELAKEGNSDAVAFPRALMHSGDYRFSLSGLKTAVINHIQKLRDAGEELPLPDICASFQQAVIDVQVAKVRRAIEACSVRTFCLGGGVAANPALRAAYQQMCAELDCRLVMPPMSACGDNAAMIALVALDRYRQGRFFGLDADALAHADISERY